MTPRDALPGSRIYLDTNLYIYLFEGVEPYRQLMTELSTEIDRRGIAVIASELISRNSYPAPSGKAAAS